MRKTKTRKYLEGGEESLKRCGLVGAYLERADLRGYNLSGANMTAASLRGADLSEANLKGTILVKADLSRACLYRANLEGAILDGADMSMSYSKSTLYKDASMRLVSLRGGTFKNCFFVGTDLRFADFRGAWMLGSLFDYAKTDNAKNLHHALFYWYRHPKGGGPSYDPLPGYHKIGFSMIPGISYQENAGMGRIICR